MKQDVKMSFYLKKNQAKSDNQCPVMARLSVGKSSDTDRGTLEYVAKLTQFHAQFRAVGVNYNGSSSL